MGEHAKASDRSAATAESRRCKSVNAAAPRSRTRGRRGGKLGAASARRHVHHGHQPRRSSTARHAARRRRHGCRVHAPPAARLPFPELAEAEQFADGQGIGGCHGLGQPSSVMVSSPSWPRSRAPVSRPPPSRHGRRSQRRPGHHTAGVAPLPPPPPPPLDVLGRPVSEGGGARRSRRDSRDGEHRRHDRSAPPPLPPTCHYHRHAPSAAVVAVKSPSASTRAASSTRIAARTVRPTAQRRGRQRHAGGRFRDVRVLPEVAQGAAHG